MEPISEPTNNKIQQSITTIHELFSKYENDKYMTEKTQHYICNQLPNILENIRITHENSVSRIEEMNFEKNIFIHNFLSNNQYFYVPSTEKFFIYEGNHYQHISEDDILHHVLSTISRDRNLMCWKQLTKKNIMKRIKENNLLKSIPESNTIQSILNELIPNLFANKYEAKYFLTILGDNLFKKNTDLIHFIDPSAKQFIRELNDFAQFYIGTNLSQTFKFKYHDNHEYTNCRLININNCKNNNLWSSLLNEHILDFICVASHYSIRFNSSDEYVINHSYQPDFVKNVFYLKDLTPTEMVSKFTDEFLQITFPANEMKTILNQQLAIDKQSEIRATQISWKNMLYLWRKYLASKGLPNIMFQQTFKNLLIEKLTDYYVEDKDAFIGICSEHLPLIQQFLQFWSDTITYDENEIDFEIEEIIILFKQWSECKNEMPSTLSDKQILDVIAYYQPDIEIEKDKYVCKIRCSLWDKRLDIQVALENMKETLRLKYYVEEGGVENYENLNSSIAGRNISIYDAYNFYCKFFSGMNGKQIVSKSYFDKYVFENLAVYITDSRYICSDWILE
jgi:hypothetical protein